jgi:hypothetical protein
LGGCGLLRQQFTSVKTGENDRQNCRQRHTMRFWGRKFHVFILWLRDQRLSISKNQKRFKNYTNDHVEKLLITTIMAAILDCRILAVKYFVYSTSSDGVAINLPFEKITSTTT